MEDRTRAEKQGNRTRIGVAVSVVDSKFQILNSATERSHCAKKKD